MVLQDIYSLQNRCYVTSLVALLTGISSTTTSQKMVWLWRQLAISTTLTLKLSSLRRMGCRCVELVCDVIKHSRNPNVIVSRNGRELLECPMCLVPMYPPVHQAKGS
uniref:Uncharacterized protein n=1 Tax=Triticum urartu TaxID=4572 RepID=A0A8R7JXD8_TRIUA